MRSKKNYCFYRLQQQIQDIIETLFEDKIKIIPLGFNKKYPRKKDYYNSYYSLNTLKEHRGNLGICVGYNHQKNGKSLAVIDIDGYTLNTSDEKLRKRVKKESADYIYEALKKIPGSMHIRTQSGGHHIYLWNKTVINNIHETSKNLNFPKDFKIPELRGKSLNQSIEIFTKWQSKQCVLPGSKIDLNLYNIEDEIRNFKDIATVEDISKTVNETLIKEGYTINREPSKTRVEKLNKHWEDIILDKDLKELTNTEINQLASILAPYFKTLSHLKHYSYFYLGGYLCNYVSLDSCKKLVKKILNLSGDDYPHHIETACKNYTRNIINKKGLNSLIENIKSRNPDFNEQMEDKLRFQINRIVNQYYHYDFPIKEINSNETMYLSIDYHSHKIGAYTINYKNGEDKSFISNKFDILNFTPESISLNYDIFDKNSKPKIVFEIYSLVMPHNTIIEGETVGSIESQINNYAGLVLEPFNFHGIINRIISEFERLDLIEVVEDVMVPGVFINHHTGKLVRSDENGIIPIIKPGIDEVCEGLRIWDLLDEIYPGDKSKLSHILRWGLLSPFSFIRKTKYGWLPMLYLFGASRTSKTTLAEICLSPYTNINYEVSLGGSSVDSEYRIGHALSNQGYGVIINEPGNILEEKSKIFDLIKRAVENPISREKFDDNKHIKIPAYSNLIFTSNSFIPSNDAFIRRCEYLEFTKSERLSKMDMELFYKTFHHHNWNDTDFKKLRAVGDYVIYYVSQHLELLKLPKEQLTNKILNALFEFAGVEPFKWLFLTAELMELSNADDEILTSFRLMVLDDYNKSVGNNPSLWESLSSIEELHAPSEFGEYGLDMGEESEISSEKIFKNLFLGVVQLDKIPYLHYQIDSSGEEYIIVTPAVKQALSSYNRAKGLNLKITCKGLADYMGETYKTYRYRGKTVRSFRLNYHDFRDFLNS